jgi:hypothetical protein
LYPHLVADGDEAAADYPGEDSFPGHDAVAYGFEYGAVVAAFLADLGHLQGGAAAFQDGSYGEGAEVDALYYQVFAETAGGDIDAPLPEGFYFLMGKEAYLAVPAAGVGVADDAVVHPELPPPYVGFGGPPFFADTYRQDLGHTVSSLSIGFFYI